VVQVSIYPSPGRHAVQARRELIGNSEKDPPE
jgi:hypothetical protein